MPRYDDSRDRDRADEWDRSWDRKRDRSRDRARDRDRNRRSPSYEPERDDEGRDDVSVLFFLPSAGIDYDVICEELSLYLGAGSTVKPGNHPKSGRPGYYIRSPYSPTISMISDLEQDTIDWREERAKWDNRDYRKSQTHYRRQRPKSSNKSSPASEVGSKSYSAFCRLYDIAVIASSQMRRAKRYLPMVINGSKYRTVPDTGSLENAISADEVRRLRLNFTGNIRQFVMGNGSTTMSLGSVPLKCAFAQGDSHTTIQQFNVIENLAVPVIMGKRFLDNSKTLTLNQHRLEVIYTTVKRTLHLLHLDRPRQLMRCYVNGSLVHANADTGAEMDLMSPSFALSNSLNIETLDEWERRVELADGSMAELSGKVRVDFDAYDVYSSSPTKSKRHVRTFYLMEGLTSDVLLGEDALYDINAFTEHSDSFFESSDCDECPELNLITWFDHRERQVSDALGVLSSASTKDMSEGELQKLLSKLDARELHHRNVANEKIKSLPIADQPAQEAIEKRRRQEYDAARARLRQERDAASNTTRHCGTRTTTSAPNHTRPPRRIGRFFSSNSVRD